MRSIRFVAFGVYALVGIQHGFLLATLGPKVRSETTRTRLHPDELWVGSLAPHDYFRCSKLAQTFRRQGTPASER